jgi:signal transduction histidine kinase
MARRPPGGHAGLDSDEPGGKVTQRTVDRPRVARPRLGGSLAYMLVSVPLGFLALPLAVASVAGVVLTIVWVGIPIMIAVAACWRALARTERRWVGVTLGVDIEVPYRSLPAGSALRRWRAKVRDPATWRDIGYLMLRVPFSAAETALVVVLWVSSLGLTALPVWAPILPVDNPVNMPDLHFRIVPIRTAEQALPYAAVGLVILILAFLLTPRIARFQAVVARALLSSSHAQRLAAAAEHLHASRARGVDAAEAERRRIERDLHDGAQQRLVSVAMTLGRARTKLESDPASARALIDEAHADAKLAVAELRDLARGIFPAVLGDRGLDAALSALAARSPVPVDVDVDVTPRPPTAVESTAYFIVAEALTNVAKHAGATAVVVSARRAGDLVTVVISDDGAGGAQVTPGGGLSGLADRAATIDGVMTVTSPPGGPTVVTAELPCVW